MRLIRIAVPVLFVLCLALYIWTSATYEVSHNTEGPVITCDPETLELSVAEGEDALMQGLTAYDTQDGDLTHRILLTGKSVFLEPGVFQAEYVVFDSHQNSDICTRRICYTDYASPEFRLTDALNFTKGNNIRFLNYISAYDVLDGDLTENIKVKASNVSNYTAGDYPVLLEVTNSFGDTVQVELMVVVREPDQEGPVIALSDYLVYLTPGETFDPEELILSVTAHNGFRLARTGVQILGTVDTQTPGCYQLLFTCEDEYGTGRTYLTVVVTGEVAE